MQLSRHVRLLFSILVLTTATIAYAGDPAKARKRLERDGNEFTVEGFLKEISYGEPKNVELYLEAGMSPDAADEKGMSALHTAATEDDPRMLAILLKAKPKLDPRKENRDTPLCDAASGELPKNVEQLIKAGADVNAVCDFDMTPLHEAARQADIVTVNLLLAAGANVDARESHGETPLLIAAHQDSLAVVNALVKAGADVNTRGKSGNTPLHEAVSSDKPEIAKALLDAGADPNPKNSGGRTPLLEAASYGRPKVIPVLLAAGADPKMKSDGTTPLAAAKEEGNKEIIDMLENARPVTPRALAPARSAAASESARPSAGDALAQLKKMGITTVDAMTVFGRVEARDTRAVSLLIAGGVKPNVRNDQGRTPLWEAIENDDLAMVKALITAGADVNDPGKAAQKEYEYGQTLVTQTVDRDNAELLAALIAAGADVNKVSAYGMTALMNAAMQGKAEHVTLLIAAKANVNAVDSNGTPTVFSAVKGGNVEVLRMMIAAGANVSPSKKLLLENAESSEMKAMLTSAAAKEPAGTRNAPKPKAPPAPEIAAAPKPVTLALGKKPVTAKQVYDAILPIARKWQADAELTDLGTLSNGLLDASGGSAHWNAKFYSPSAQKVNLMSVDEGSLVASDHPSNQLRIVTVTETTILDTARLNEIAENAGANAYTSRGMRPTATMIHNPVTGDVWYFNYSDPSTEKNVLTIVIDANSGKVRLKDAK